MATIRCKMCGGDLLLTEGATTAKCEYCGSLQTVPQVDQEKKLNLFTRANRLRFGCDFDKAFGVYETIVGEYPEEPEAYWGLVLCKYGIEYVDDPLTARKIPTCHRASFESVPEDSNYQMTLEYADAEARKLYRQEAKTIENLRKGIQEISSKEAPYDIFICYKETGLNSTERTLDSVLAQDLYDTLTRKGYRVFFSRVTLEDKVGQEYEPYIFAALNSAKIMLVVGTDYEHFHAVWVKNEWRRYLKLMEEDRDKHLIPCYKDMDIEDIPQEFRRLQAQDLGKVGAEQDLLRGIEKLLPLETRGAAPKRKMDAAVAALLERGYIALEDRQWEDADACFEKVLQQDPQNGDSYVGKLLAFEHRKSLEALVEKWVEAYNNTRPVTHTIAQEGDRYRPENMHHAALEFVDQEALGQLYQFNTEYTSEVESCEELCRQGQKMWQENRYLIRAEEYADEALSRQLLEAKGAFLGELKDYLERAKKAARENEQQLLRQYGVDLEHANQQAARLYREAEEALAEHYRLLCDRGAASVDPIVLNGIATDLEAMGDYQEAVSIARAYREKAKKITKEKELQKEIDKQKKRELDTQIYKAEMRKATVKKIWPAFLIVLMLVVATLLSQCENDEPNSYGYYTYYSHETIIGKSGDQAFSGK